MVTLLIACITSEKKYHFPCCQEIATANPDDATVPQLSIAGNPKNLKLPVFRRNGVTLCSITQINNSQL